MSFNLYTYSEQIRELRMWMPFQQPLGRGTGNGNGSVPGLVS